MAGPLEVDASTAAGASGGEEEGGAEGWAGGGGAGATAGDFFGDAGCCILGRFVISGLGAEPFPVRFVPTLPVCHL